MVLSRRLSIAHWLVLLLIGGVCVRIGVALYLGDTIHDIRGGTQDQVTYDALAQRVVGGYGFSFSRDWWPATRAGEPTAHWSYAYTLFLAGIYWSVGHHPLVARLIQSVLVGLLMPYLIYRIGVRTFNQRTALIAAAIVAGYAYLAHYAASLMTESFYIVCMLWVVDVSLRIAQDGAAVRDTARQRFSPVWVRGLELGVAVGLALLFRQVFVVMVMVIVGWLVWMGWRQTRTRQVLRTLVLAASVCGALIIPWLIRNYLAFDLITFLPNTNSGFAFFWANHPIYGTQFEAVLSPEAGATYQELIPVELRHLSEAALDRALLVRGLSFVLEDPVRYLLLSLSRVPVYFKFWPTPDSTLLSNVARVLSSGLFLPFMLYGLVLTVRRLLDREDGGTRETTSPLANIEGGEDLCPPFVLLLILLIVSYSGVHILSWAHVRYRLPVDALLILFAAYAIASLVDRFRTRRVAPSHPLSSVLDS
jgi:4-amino-4-deoxy-L-arabinose transferase-like glycosyltransferase